MRTSPTAAARRRSRQLALQGLYEWAVGRADRAAVDAHIREQADYPRCDAEHYDALLRGCIEQVETIDAALARHVDRRFALLSPVELAALRIGTYELQACLDIPYRVVINEAVELSKTYGGTDGHRFVNGVLDKVAGDLRPAEVAERGGRAKRATPGAPGHDAELPT